MLNNFVNDGTQRKHFKQVKRRWFKVLQPSLQRQWNRLDALKFCDFVIQNTSSTRKFLGKIKKDFPGYTLKMLNYKLKQLNKLSNANFIMMHSYIKQRKHSATNLDAVTNLSKQLESKFQFEDGFGNVFLKEKMGEC